MLSLTNAASMRLFVDVHPDPELRSLLSFRMAQLALPEGADIGDAVHFLVFEPGDRLCQLEANLAFTPLQNLVDGSFYGDLDFTPSWEWAEDHGGWFELVFIFTDDGFAHLLFVPDDEDVDAVLLAMCREHCRRSDTQSAADPPPGLNDPTEP